MRIAAVTLALALAVTPALARADKVVASLACMGGPATSGEASLNANGDLSGSLRTTVAPSDDVPIICNIGCGEDVYPIGPNTPCGTFKKGHKTAKFKAKGLGIDECFLPRPVISTNTGVSCSPNWAPKLR